MTTRELSKEAREFFAEHGRAGALKQAADMTPEQRKRRARKAALTRWRAWRKRKRENSA